MDFVRAHYRVVINNSDVSSPPSPSLFTRLADNKERERNKKERERDNKERERDNKEHRVLILLFVI